MKLFSDLEVSKFALSRETCITNKVLFKIEKSSHLYATLPLDNIFQI